jgi:hypothetical protein
MKRTPLLTQFLLGRSANGSFDLDRRVVDELDSSQTECIVASSLLWATRTLRCRAEWRSCSGPRRHRQGAASQGGTQSEITSSELEEPSAPSRRRRIRAGLGAFDSSAVVHTAYSAAFDQPFRKHPIHHLGADGLVVPRCVRAAPCCSASCCRSSCWADSARGWGGS